MTPSVGFKVDWGACPPSSQCSAPLPDCERIAAAVHERPGPCFLLFRPPEVFPPPTAPFRIRPRSRVRARGASGNRVESYSGSKLHSHLETLPQPEPRPYFLERLIRRQELDPWGDCP